MSTFRTTRVLLIAAALTVGFGSAAFAFHSGGVGECVGCHNMHGGPSGSKLLAGADASSTCLNCHEQAGLTSPSSYHMSTASSDMGPGISPFQRTPGGDFGWLKKTYTWTVPWGTFGEAGETHGHNIVAPSYGYFADSENTVAPGGGSLAAGDLACTSCHDPHGKYRRINGDTGYTIATSGAPIIGSGSYQTSPAPGPSEAVGVYRLLAGVGYETPGDNFAVNPPHASAPNQVFGGPGATSGYNSSEATNQVRVAYGDGMSAWCATCHPQMISGVGSGHHPAGQDFSGDVLDDYNAYRGSGLPSGSVTDSYLSLVPYEEGSADYGVLKGLAIANAPTYAGPATQNAQVACISCHRAHATGFEYAVRWNPESEFLTYAGLWPGSDNGSPPQFARGRTEVEMQAAYYDRSASVFSTYQRQLCNKCHTQD